MLATFRIFNLLNFTLKIFIYILYIKYNHLHPLHQFSKNNSYIMYGKEDIIQTIFSLYVHPLHPANFK